MKITTKIILLVMAALLPMGFAGCSDDDEPNSGGKEETPDFVLDKETIKVKIGPDTKVTVNIQDGGGEYSVFCLDEKLAKAELANNVITVEGFANGITSLIISDKYSRYLRLPVNVYTTETLQLSDKEMELVARLGSSNTIKASVVLGNGEYKVETDDPKVTAKVDTEGVISISAISKKADYTATVTVTDCTNLSADITVVVKASLKPFTTAELEEITSKNFRAYSYNDANTYISNGIVFNEVLPNGKQKYGWDYWNYYWMYVEFAGGKSVGVKSDAIFSFAWHPNRITEPVTLEIIKNDGTNLWGTFFYIDDEEEILYRGHFCDTVEPAP